MAILRARREAHMVCFHHIRTVHDSYRDHRVDRRRLRWPRRPDIAMTPAAVGIGVVVGLVVVAVAVHRRWRRTAAGGSRVNDAVISELIPPADATPGELGTVFFGETKYNQVSATVIDLAERGHLHAHALPSAIEGVTLSWLLEFHNGRDALRRYEEVLVDELGLRAEPQVFPTLTHGATTKIATAVHAEVVQRGWFVDDPTRARSHSYRGAGAGVLLGLVATFVLGALTTWAAVGLGLMLGSLIALTIADRSAVLTTEGHQLAARAHALRHGITQRPAHIESYCFSYAVALGVSTKFAAVLDARRAETPPWISDDNAPVTWGSVDDFALTARYGWALRCPAVRG